IVPNWVRSCSACGTGGCARTSATSRPSTMPSRPSTRPSAAWERRSSAFVREDSGTATDPALLTARLYDLRHAAVSQWLTAGLPAAEVADRAGIASKCCCGCDAKWLDDGQEAALPARRSNRSRITHPAQASRMQHLEDTLRAVPNDANFLGRALRREMAQ